MMLKYNTYIFNIGPIVLAVKGNVLPQKEQN
jgi:hypothetical protein